MKSETTGAVLGKIIEIQKKIVSNKSEIILTPEVFGPRKCYGYKGAK
jgi:predicted amidohydrolase